jgi:hypothetical protein
MLAEHEGIQLSRPSVHRILGRLVDELGIRLIRARSPQAKGRVERLWGTFQDRLGSELRLAGTSDRHQAQIVLERDVARHNRRFAVPPVDPLPAWLPWPRQRRREGVLLLNTVVLRQRQHDSPRQSRDRYSARPTTHRLRAARCAVEVQRRFDGTRRALRYASPEADLSSKECSR